VQKQAPCAVSRAREKQAKERSAAYWEQRQQVWIAASDEQREAVRHARTEAELRRLHQKKEWSTFLASLRFVVWANTCVADATEERVAEMREKLAAIRIQKCVKSHSVVGHVLWVV
jgi:hypothetical protein